MRSGARPTTNAAGTAIAQHQAAPAAGATGLTRTPGATGPARANPARIATGATAAADTRRQAVAKGRAGATGTARTTGTKESGYPARSTATTVAAGLTGPT